MNHRVCPLIMLVLAALACNMPTIQMSGTATPGITQTVTKTNSPTQVPATVTLSPPTETLPIPPATALPSASPTLEPPQHGALLYETRFTQGWPPLTGDKANGKAISGGYQIDITQPWALYAYTTRARQSTFYAEITASPLQCPAGNGGYGMIFHYQSDTAYRFITVWCSSRYSVLERTGSAATVTLGEGALPQEVSAATGVHTVGISAAANNKVTVYVDSIKVGQIDVTSLPTGDVGPYAETTGDPLSVLFSRLAVYASQ